MKIRLSPASTAALIALLLSGCVKQHAKWNEVPPVQAIPLPYFMQPAPSRAPVIGRSHHQNAAKTEPFSAGSSLPSRGEQRYSSSTGGSSGSYGGNSHRSRSGNQWVVVAAILIFMGAPFAWLFYPSWRRSTRSEQPAPSAIQVPLVPPIPPRVTWDEQGLCPNCGSRMVPREARRGRHKGKSFYGCSKYPICKGIRQTAPPKDESH